MKNLLIIIGTVLLGAFIFDLMVGDGQNSLKTTVRFLMKENFAGYIE